MPGGEIGQVLLDHLGRVGEFRLGHARPVELRSLELCHDVPPVSPAVEVPAVLGQHLAHQSEFAVPQVPGGVGFQPFVPFVEQP